MTDVQNQNPMLVHYGSHRARYASQLSLDVNKLTTACTRAQLSSTAFPVMALECPDKQSSCNNFLLNRKGYMYMIQDTHAPMCPYMQLASCWQLTFKADFMKSDK